MPQALPYKHPGPCLPELCPACPCPARCSLLTPGGLHVPRVSSLTMGGWFRGDPLVS